MEDSGVPVGTGVRRFGGTPPSQREGGWEKTEIRSAGVVRKRKRTIISTVHYNYVTTYVYPLIRLCEEEKKIRRKSTLASNRGLPPTEVKAMCASKNRPPSHRCQSNVSKYITYTSLTIRQGDPIIVVKQQLEDFILKHQSNLMDL